MSCHPSSVFCSYMSTQNHSYSVALCFQLPFLSNTGSSSSRGQPIGIGLIRSRKSYSGIRRYPSTEPCQNRSCVQTPVFLNRPNAIVLEWANQRNVCTYGGLDAILNIRCDLMTPVPASLSRMRDKARREERCCQCHMCHPVRTVSCDVFFETPQQVAACPHSDYVASA